MDRRAPSPRPRMPTALRRVSLLVTVALTAVVFPGTGPVGAAAVTLTAEADATVDQSHGDDNFGTTDTLGVDSSPRHEAYLRFSVPALSGPVASATLRLWVVDRTSNGPEVRLTSSDWAEPDITWSNRPAVAGSAAADARKLTAGSWVTFDVTSIVSGPGPVSFVLQPDSSDGAGFASREAPDHRPELTVEARTEGATSAVFSPLADADVAEADPDANFGSETRLRVEGGSDPDLAAYLRFDVNGLSGTVRRAILRVFVFNDTTDGPAVYPTSTGWTENGLTWSNRPAATGAAADDAGAVDDGWLELDVTGIVAADGPSAFLLASGSSDSLAVRSREAGASERPQLVVETDTTTSTTSTSTTSTSTTSTSTTSTSTTSTSTTTTTTAPPTTPPAVAESGEPWLGLARVVTRTCTPSCVQRVYALSVADVEPSDGGDRENAFRYVPGSQATLRVEWERTGDGGTCDSPGAATSIEVSMRRPGGARIGDDVWRPTLPGTCTGALTRTIHFDADPLDADPGDGDHYGVMEVYGRLVGGAEDGADTRGTSAAGQRGEPGRYARGHLLSGGVMVGWHEDGDDPALLAAHEDELGEPFGLVRAYSASWQMPSDRIEGWMADSKFVLWSVKPPKDVNGAFDWTPVADGSQDAMIREQVAQLQRWAAEHDTQVGYVFHHEPHDDGDLPGEVDDCENPNDSEYPCVGTPQEFIDAYERIRAEIDAQGADRVLLVYTATLSTAAARVGGSDALGSGDPMTLGTAGESVIQYVDLLAHNSYNWYCFRSSCDWEYADETGMWERGATLAAEQNKQMILAETASHPGCPDATAVQFGCDDEDPGALPSPDRDEWFRRIGEYFESDALARRWIVGFAYYHSFHTHDWRFVDATGVGDTGEPGWRETFVADSPHNDDLGGHDYFAPYGFNNL